MATEIERGGLDLGGPHEPSYYEIALTNRQVVVAFVVLLVCLVAAFLSGMWIGRDSTARSGQQMARLTPGPGGADKTDAQPQALQEFKFFNETKRKPGAEAQRTAGDRSAATTGSADRTPPPAHAAAPAVPVPIEAPPAAPTTSATGSGGAEAKAAAAVAAPKTPPVSAAAAQAGAPSTATHSAPAPASSPAVGDVVIQVFSTADKEQADKVRERLVKAGQPAFLSPIDKNGQTMYRVRIGPFSSRESAQATAERVRREQKLDTWITPK